MAQTQPDCSGNQGARALAAFAVPETDFQLIADAQRFAAEEVHWVGNRLACYTLSLAAARQRIADADAEGVPVDVVAVAEYLDDARRNEVLLRRLILRSRLNLLLEAA